MSRYEPVDDEEVIEDEVDDIEVIDSDEVLFDSQDVEEADNEEVIAKPDPAIDLLTEYRNSIIRQVPKPSKYNIYTRMSRLKAWLYAIRDCYAKKYYEMDNLGKRDPRVKVLKDHINTLKGEFYDTVCKVYQLAVDAFEYYMRTGETRGIEELIDLYNYRIRVKGIPKYCAKSGSYDPNQAYDLIKLCGSDVFTSPEWRDFIDRSHRIETLLRLPNKTEILELLL